VGFCDDGDEPLGSIMTGIFLMVEYIQTVWKIFCSTELVTQITTGPKAHVPICSFMVHVNNPTLLNGSY